MASQRQASWIGLTVLVLAMAAIVADTIAPEHDDPDVGDPSDPPVQPEPTPLWTAPGGPQLEEAFAIGIGFTVCAVLWLAIVGLRRGLAWMALVTSSGFAAVLELIKTTVDGASATFTHGAAFSLGGVTVVTCVLTGRGLASIARRLSTR